VQRTTVLVDPMYTNSCSGHFFVNSLFRDDTLFGFTTSKKRHKICVSVMHAAFERRRVVNNGISKLRIKKLNFFLETILSNHVDDSMSRNAIEKGGGWVYPLCGQRACTLFLYLLSAIAQIQVMESVHTTII
jgi:hypothetical protein